HQRPSGSSLHGVRIAARQCDSLQQAWGLHSNSDHSRSDAVLRFLHRSCTGNRPRSPRNALRRARRVRYQAPFLGARSEPRDRARPPVRHGRGPLGRIQPGVRLGVPRHAPPSQRAPRSGPVSRRNRVRSAARSWAPGSLGTRSIRPRHRRNLKIAPEVPIRSGNRATRYSPRGFCMERPRVLVVDDEKTVQHVLTTLLQQQGYETESAGSAEVALSKLDGGPISVAVLDIVLPGMNGLELLARIKARDPDAE